VPKRCPDSGLQALHRRDLEVAEGIQMESQSWGQERKLR